VYEDGIGVDCAKTRTYRIRSLGSAADQLAYCEAGECSCCSILLAFAHHDAHFSQCRMTDQRLHRPAKDRLSAEQPELLGNPPAEAFALSSSNDERSCGHGGRV